MSKKARITVAATVTVTLLAALAVYLLFFRGGAYVSSLPADALALARLDVRALKGQAALSALGDRWTQIEHSGIDLGQPLYAYVDGHDCPGALLPLSDASHWQEYLAQQGIEVQRQRGYRWAQSGEWLMAFSDDRCLISGPLSQEEMGRMRGQMAALMKQKGEPDNPLLKQVATSKAALSAAFSTSLARHLLERFLPQACAIWPAGEEGTVGVEVRMQDKRMHADVTLQGTGLRQGTTPLRPLNAAGVPVLDGDRMASVTMGLDGEALLKTLRKWPAVRTALIAMNFCLDLDMMIRSVNGAVTLSLPGDDDALSGTLFTAQLRDTRFMQDSKDWAQGLSAGFGVQMNSLADSAFALRWQDYNVCFGVHDGQLQAGTSEAAFLQAFGKEAHPSGNGTQEADGSLAYVQVRLPALREHASIIALLAGKQTSLMDILAQYETLTISIKAQEENTEDKK